MSQIGKLVLRSHQRRAAQKQKSRAEALLDNTHENIQDNDFLSQ